MKRLWILLLVLSFTGLFAGEPLHAIFHGVSETRHVEATTHDAQDATVAAPEIVCRFLDAWIALIHLPALQAPTALAPEFALDALAPEEPSVHRLFSRPIDAATRPRGPPASAPSV